MGLRQRAGVDPRSYVINYPQPGTYVVQSVGTGGGAFTVHVYSVETIKGASRHLSSTGMASPGEYVSTTSLWMQAARLPSTTQRRSPMPARIKRCWRMRPAPRLRRWTAQRQTIRMAIR